MYSRWLPHFTLLLNYKLRSFVLFFEQMKPKKYNSRYFGGYFGFLVAILDLNISMAEKLISKNIVWDRWNQRQNLDWKKWQFFAWHGPVYSFHPCYSQFSAAAWIEVDWLMLTSICDNTNCESVNDIDEPHIIIIISGHLCVQCSLKWNFEHINIILAYNNIIITLSPKC